MTRFARSSTTYSCCLPALYRNSIYSSAAMVGSGTVPWRLVSLFREFADKVAVLVPYKAYSAATMLALGADEIVMGPLGEMGPIDPIVANEFNPVDPTTRQKIAISVEDVVAYIGFIKDTVGIRHEVELVKAIEVLAQNVHPLALGNVERFVSQSRLIARKIMLTHMKGPPEPHESPHFVKDSCWPYFAAKS